MKIWEQIKTQIKANKKYSGIYELWIEPVKEKKFENKTLFLSLPSEFFIKKFKDFYPDIKEYSREILGFEISIELILERVEIPSLNISYRQNQKKKNFQEIKREKTTFDNSPKFKSEEELDNFFKDTKDKKIEQVETKQITLVSMPSKYGLDKVVNFAFFSGDFFTHPKDKRPSAVVKMKLNLENGKIQEYELHRGVMAFGDEGNGQLNTTHAKILLAILHIWQKQGSNFLDDKGYFSFIKVYLKDLADELGYKKSGRTYKWLLTKIKEILNTRNMLVNGTEGIGFKFLEDVSIKSDKENKNKTVLNLSFTSFISKQLWERRAFFRSRKVYRIENPTALKFLLCYDKAIYKGNKLKLNLKTIIKDLQMNFMNKADIIRALKSAIKEINGYELSEEFIVKAELIKENKEYYIIAEREKKSVILFEKDKIKIIDDFDNSQTELIF